MLLLNINIAYEINEKKIQEFFTDSLTSEVGLNFDLQETIRVLNEKLELKNRKLEDLQEKLDKFEDLKIKVRLFIKGQLTLSKPWPNLVTPYTNLLQTVRH